MTPVIRKQMERTLYLIERKYTEADLSLMESFAELCIEAGKAEQVIEELATFESKINRAFEGAKP